jgi:hypothetical protein
MVYSETTLTEKTALIKNALDKAEAIIIGVGSGLSRTRYAREAAGLAYDNANTFNTLFPGLSPLRQPLNSQCAAEQKFCREPWLEKYEMLNDFLDANRGKKMLFLELGAGFNTPGIIRNEFEFLFMMRKYAEMIRINLNIVEITLLYKEDRAAIIQGDLGPILGKLVEGY